MRQLLSSFGFGATFPPASAPFAPSVRIEPIRAAMRAALGDPAPPDCAMLLQRIGYAADAQRLWSLRGELMQALGSMRGEAQAARELAGITAMFHDLLPPGLASCLAPRLGR